jgi:hypothetical protein
MTMTDMATGNSDNCEDCGKSTSFGSGRFVNRVPSDNGYICAECMGRECDFCDQPIALDEDIWVVDPVLDEWNICQDCFNFNPDVFIIRGIANKTAIAHTAKQRTTQ